MIKVKSAELAAGSVPAGGFLLVPVSRSCGCALPAKWRAQTPDRTMKRVAEKIPAQCERATAAPFLHRLVLSTIVVVVIIANRCWRVALAVNWHTPDPLAFGPAQLHKMAA